jgi:hypothetical protein
VPIAEVREYSSVAVESFRKMTSEIHLTFHRGGLPFFFEAAFGSAPNPRKLGLTVAEAEANFRGPRVVEESRF